jgi:site-specific DNA-methyltransferase (adenine-specific)
MELKKLPLKNIVPYPDNPRKNDGAVDAVAESIKQCQYITPIVVDEDMVILAGHTRYKALKKLGRTEAEVIIKEGLTEEQKRKYRLLDNKTNEFADWDFDLLADELDGLDFDGFDFNWGIDDEEDPEVEEDDYDAEPPAEPKAKRGDIYQLGRHRLMCGDSTKDVDILLDGAEIELLMTDPPYGINADKMTMGTGKKDFHRGDWDGFRPPIEQMIDIAEKVCIWGGNYFTDVLPITNNWLCWWKKNDGLSFSEFELAWTNFGKNCRHIAHHWGNEKKLHVTMKPLEVIAWAIRQSDTTGNVADLFGGSGSTLIACEQLNRTCYMMELDPKYVDVIIDRWEKLTGEKAVLL